MGKVRVDEVVQDRVGEEVCPGLQQSGIFLSQADSALLKVREHLIMDCDDELLRDEQRQLVGDELVGPHNRTRDDKQEVNVDVDARAPVMNLRDFESQRMQAEQSL